jgi:hypothetical protein
MDNDASSLECCVCCTTFAAGLAMMNIPCKHPICVPCALKVCKYATDEADIVSLAAGKCPLCRASMVEVRLAFAPTVPMLPDRFSL